VLFFDPVPENVNQAILWALCCLVVAMGGALVWVIKSKPPSNGNGKSKVSTSGEISVEIWEKKIDDIVCTAIDERIAPRLNAIEEKLRDMKSGSDQQLRDVLAEIRNLITSINSLALTMAGRKRGLNGDD